MIEVYTNTARKALLIGRMEAVRSGCSSVETEHFVAGLLRADLPLALRLFRSTENVEATRASLLRDLHKATEKRSVAAVIDLALSPDCARVVSFASAEAVRLGEASIAPTHLFLGVLRENKSKAASIITDHGVTIQQLEEEAERATVRTSAVKGLPQITRLRDLVAEVRVERGKDLVGRRRELEQLIQILCRRTRNSAVLLGDAGVGKETLVHGLARRIAEDDVPADLVERHILMVEASELALALRQAVPFGSGDMSLQQRLFEISQKGGPILYVRGLFDLRGDLSSLANYLKSGKLQIIASGAPLAFRLSFERDEQIARSFEVVSVLPPSDADAVKVIAGMKHEFENFHGVTISEEAVQTAVTASARFLRHRALPDRALDLIDDAETLVKLRCESVPPELAALQRRIRSLVRRKDNAEADRKLDLARQLAWEENQEREKFETLKKELDTTPRSRMVTPDDVLEAVANRNFATVESVKQALDRTPLSDVEAEVRTDLCAGMPVGRRDWVEGMMAYLAECSREDAERLLQAIENAKTKLDQEAEP